MKKTPRQLTRREQACLAHVRRARARKMSLAQYCRAKGLNVQSLYDLRHQLAVKKPARANAPTKKSKPESNAEFPLNRPT